MRPEEGCRGGRRVLAAAAGCLAFQLVLFLPMILGGEVLLPVSPCAAPPWFDPASPPSGPADWAATDKIVFNYPNLARWTQKVLVEPEALLWNPWNFTGIAFLATQNTCVLYPLNVVYLLAGPAEGLLVAAILHGFLASFLAFLALRRLPVGEGAAFVGGLIYGGSSWFIVHHDLIQFVQSATWVPLLVLGADLCGSSRRSAGPVALALGFVLSFFGGMPQITLLGLFLAGLVVLARAAGLARRSRSWRAPGGVLLRAALGVVLGLLLAAPQLLPTLEIRQTSGRAELTAAEIEAGAMKPIDLAGLLVPELLGNPPELARVQQGAQPLLPPGTTEASFLPARAAGVDASGHTFIERAFHPGVAALMLAVLALITRPTGPKVFAVVVVAIGLLGALPSPVQDALTQLPVFRFGSARRFVFLAAAGFALLGALGYHELVARSRRCGAVLLATGAAVLPLVVFIAIIAIAPDLVRSWCGAGPGDATQAAALPRWFLLVSWPALLVAGGAAALLALARLAGRGRTLVLLTVVLAAELAPLSWRSNPGQPRGEIFPATRTIRWLQAQRGDLAAHPDPSGAGLFRLIRFKDPGLDLPVARTLPAPLPPNLGLPFEIFDAQGYEAIVDRRIEELFECLEPGLAVEHHLIRELRRLESLQSPILDLLGVRFVLSSGRLPLAPLHVAYEELVAIYENPGALPRFVEPERVTILGSDAEVLERLRDRSFDPAREVFLLAGDAERLGLGGRGEWLRPAGAPRAKLELLGYRATEVRIGFELAAATPLLVTDAYHPGWTAEVEGGSELTLVRADHALRMIVLPPGKGVVVLRFRPTSLRAGWLAGLAGLALMLLLVLWSRRGRAPDEAVPGLQEAART